MVNPSAQTAAAICAQPQPKRRGSKQFRNGAEFSSPRRFNDKIALQQMRQAEHEKLFNEVNTHVHSFSAGGRPAAHAMPQVAFPSNPTYCFASHAQNTAAAAAAPQQSAFNPCTPQAQPHQQQLYDFNFYADHYRLGGSVGYLQSPAAHGAGVAPVTMHCSANNIFVYPEAPLPEPSPCATSQAGPPTFASFQHPVAAAAPPADCSAGVYTFRDQQQQGPHGLPGHLQPRTKRMYSTPDVHALPVATSLLQQGAPKVKLERRFSLDNLHLSATTSKPAESPTRRQPQASRRASHGSLHSGKRGSPDSNNSKLENLLSVLLSRDPSAQAQQQHRAQQQRANTLQTPPSCPQLLSYLPSLQPLTPTTPSSQMAATDGTVAAQHISPLSARQDQLGHLFSLGNGYVPSPTVDTTTPSLWASLPPTPLDTSPLSTPNSTEDAAFILDLTRLTELHMANSDNHHMNIDTSMMINFSAADVDRLFPGGF